MVYLKTMGWTILALLLSLPTLWLADPDPVLADSMIVQVMSVNNQTSASAEVDRLLAQGVPSFQRAERVEGVGLRYRVYLGPFDSSGEATGAAEALKSSGLITEYIVRNDNPAAASSVVSPAATQAPVAGAPTAQTPVGQAPTDQAPVTQDYWPPSQGQTTAPVQSAPPSQDYWPPPASTPAPPTAPTRTAPSSQDYWPPLPEGAGTAPTSQDYWPPPPGQAPAQGTQSPTPVVAAPVMIPQSPGEPVLAPSAQGQSVPVVPVVQAPAAPAMIPQGPGEPVLAPSAQGALRTQPGSDIPVLPPAQGQPVPVVPVAQAPAAPVTIPQSPGEPVLAPSAQAGVTQSPANNQRVIPAKPTGPMKIQGFEILTDLSSSMRRLSACPGGLVKQEAVNTLLRKMNHRIPSQPYMAALRVFGYKQAWTRSDYTTLYFGPATYDRAAMEGAIGRLFAADSISPFGFALTSSENELAFMNNPKVVLMFADFEETTDSGAPVDKAKAIRRKYGDETKIYTFYITRRTTAERLASNIAKAGGGNDYNICDVLMSEASFESMMNDIFGPADLPPCKDSDGDGVCDERDVCPATPGGAPVDERGCWIAAYSQFFDFDKAEVKSEFQPRLKYAAELILRNPKMGQIIIAGHTDGKGTDDYNMDLGRRRAEAVKELLVKFGAPADRLVVESYGKSRPIATNDTEEGRAKNRRVEFHVGDVPK